MDPPVRSGDPKRERPWTPGAAKEVGGAWTSLYHNRWWSGNGSCPMGTPREMGLMRPPRIARSSRRFLGAQEGFL